MENAAVERDSSGRGPFQGDVTPERESFRRAERDGPDRYPTAHYGDEGDRRASVHDDVVAAVKEHDPDWQSSEEVERSLDDLDREDRDTRGESAEEAPQDGQQPEQDQNQQSDRHETRAAPTSWTREAKAEWSKLSPKIQREVLKREKDVEKGVSALKDQYKELDEAIAPYLPAIKQAQRTPGQAIGYALQKFTEYAQYDPVIQTITKPARTQQDLADKAMLLKDIAINQGVLLANGQLNPVLFQQQDPTQPQPQQYQQQQYQPQNQDLDQRVNYLVQQGISNHKARVELDAFSKDRPFFSDVRFGMAALMSPDPETGRAVINVNDYHNIGEALAAAYDHMVWANPQIRAQLQAKAQNKQAQADHVRNARRAGTSITSNVAPGNGEVRRGRDTRAGRGETVGETLRRTIEELR